MEVLPIFVYGTLQRGEQRESCWPHPPLRIEWATVQGELRDLGPHPAMVHGDAQIRGELWYVAAAHLAETLQVLDQIEGYSQPGQADWYRRVIMECRTAEGSRRAYTYLFAREHELADAPPVVPDRSGVSHWRRHR